MILHQHSCSTVIKEYLVEKQKLNSKYSLRAFAKHLKISPAQLCQIMKGKKFLSPEKALDIATTLNFKTDEKDYFCTLATLECAKTQEAKNFIKEQITQKYPQNNFHLLELDAFKIISDWHHYAILEMTELSDFKIDPSWIAKKLNISELEVELATERLKRLKLLKYSQGKWRKTKEIYFAKSDISNNVLQKYHRQTLKKAEESLEQQDISRRHLSSVVFSMDTAKIPLAKKKIENFLLEMETLLGKGNKKTHTYQLATQFFSLTD